jgi:hypothetical protein
VLGLEVVMGEVEEEVEEVEEVEGVAVGQAMERRAVEGQGSEGRVADLALFGSPGAWASVRLQQCGRSLPVPRHSPPTIATRHSDATTALLSNC